jgi:hypothetical protein
MKNGSTGARKQSRNISQQKLTIGLDLGDRNCQRFSETRGSADSSGHTLVTIEHFVRERWRILQL